MLIQKLTDDGAQQIYDIVISVMAEQKQAEISFDPRYTEESRAERMARFFELSTDIEIDKQTIKDLREASMIYR